MAECSTRKGLLKKRRVSGALAHFRCLTSSPTPPSSENTDGLGELAQDAVELPDCHRAVKSVIGAFLVHALKKRKGTRKAPSKKSIITIRRRRDRLRRWHRIAAHSSNSSTRHSLIVIRIDTDEIGFGTGFIGVGACFCGAELMGGAQIGPAPDTTVDHVRETFLVGDLEIGRIRECVRALGKRQGTKFAS